MDDITGSGNRKGSHLPLHAKAVEPIDVAALLRLPSVPPSVSRALRWLNDEELYHQLAARARSTRMARPSALSPQDVEIMTTLGRYEAISEAQAHGLSNVFAVTEHAKARRRHILEPLLNDVLLPADFDTIILPTPATVREGMKKYSMQFDASSFYDQFRLAPGVSAFFAFRGRDGIFRRYTRLPMGFRPACSVAQAVMAFLAEVGVEGVVAMVYIDNVLFTSDNKDALLEAGRRFRDRCAQCNVTLNEPGVALADLVVPGFDFLGVEYDLAARTCRNTAKTEEKLRAASAVLEGPSMITLRQMAAIFGVLFWAQQIAPLRLAPFFSALRFFRHLPLEAYAAHWNAPAPPLPQLARLQLRQWLLLASARPARPLITPSVPAPELRMWVDACASGWGALVERTTDGSILRLARGWSVEDSESYNLTSSVTTEPLGMRRAIAAVATATTRAIEVHTDHQPLVCAWHAGRGRIAAYNDCILAVQAAYPQLHVDVRFVAGAENVDADALSRGFG